MKSVLNGIDKLIVNNEAIKSDLSQNWAVIAEAIQTILRRERYQNPYEELKKLTRTNKRLSVKNIHDFIDKLDIKDSVKSELKKITPENYMLPDNSRFFTVLIRFSFALAVCTRYEELV